MVESGNVPGYDNVLHNGCPMTESSRDKFGVEVHHQTFPLCQKQCKHAMHHMCSPVGNLEENNNGNLKHKLY